MARLMKGFKKGEKKTFIESDDKLKSMKEKFFEAILPSLPIVGQLRLRSRDNSTLSEVTVVSGETPSELTPFFKTCLEKLQNYLSGQTSSLSIPLDESGLTDFQLSVLREMKKIPYGETRTYRDIAEALNTRGFQAVGSACGKNPFLLVYPCHRVLGTNGLGGFAHGQAMKTQLLALEGHQLNP